MIAVGGDGTTLNIAKSSALFDKLTLGINAGRLGFMSGLERDELALLKCLSTGDYEVEERMMIRAVVTDKNGVQSEYQCLNDAVISEFAGLIDAVQFYLDNHYDCDKIQKELEKQMMKSLGNNPIY